VRAEHAQLVQDEYVGARTAWHPQWILRSRQIQRLLAAQPSANLSTGRAL
jgi:hypothetical protein